MIAFVDGTFGKDIAVNSEILVGITNNTAQYASILGKALLFPYHGSTTWSGFTKLYGDVTNYQRAPEPFLFGQSRYLRQGVNDQVGPKPFYVPVGAGVD